MCRHPEEIEESREFVIEDCQMTLTVGQQGSDAKQLKRMTLIGLIGIVAVGVESMFSRSYSGVLATAFILGWTQLVGL